MLLLVGSISAEKVRPISANGRPLTFQVMRASATREPQLSEKPSGEYVMPGLTAERMVGGGTYRGPIVEIPRYEPMALAPSESFLIVQFSVSNVRRNLQLDATDVQLIDNRGSVYQALGRLGQKKNSWSRLYFNGVQLPLWENLDPKNMRPLTWIFKVPTDAVSGAVIKFQNATYPLNVANY